MHAPCTLARTHVLHRSASDSSVSAAVLMYVSDGHAREPFTQAMLMAFFFSFSAPAGRRCMWPVASSTIRFWIFPRTPSPCSEARARNESARALHICPWRHASMEAHADPRRTSTWNRGTERWRFAPLLGDPFGPRQDPWSACAASLRGRWLGGESLAVGWRWVGLQGRGARARLGC